MVSGRSLSLPPHQQNSQEKMSVQWSWLSNNFSHSQSNVAQYTNEKIHTHTTTTTMTKQSISFQWSSMLKSHTIFLWTGHPSESMKHPFVPSLFPACYPPVSHLASSLTIRSSVGLAFSTKLLQAPTPCEFWIWFPADKKNGGWQKLIIKLRSKKKCLRRTDWEDMRQQCSEGRRLRRALLPFSSILTLT